MVLDVISTVFPSGSARAAIPTPMLPAAPGLFSMNIEAFSSSESAGCSRRVTTSTGPPEPNGTTSRIGRSGHAANARVDRNGAAAVNVAPA